MWNALWRKTEPSGQNGKPFRPTSGWSVHAEGESTGRCDCCRSVSRLIWGKARGPQDGQADYLVHWTPGASKKLHPANFDLTVQTSSTKVFCVSMILYERDDGSSGVMVIDASRRPFATEPGPAQALSRDEVVGTPLGPQMFALFDAIWLGDPRIKQLA